MNECPSEHESGSSELGVGTQVHSEGGMPVLLAHFGALREPEVGHHVGSRDDGRAARA